MSAAAALLAMGVLGLAAGACARPPPASSPYQPTRHDYSAFQTRQAELLEPNYLPFMVHRVAGGDVEGDVLAFCRWSAESMPLPVYIEPPAIPRRMQDEFHPKDPAIYVAAVASALATWERELEGLVRFRRVADGRAAALRVRLRGQVGEKPDPGRQGLGRISLAGACRAEGSRAGPERLRVHFAVSELEIFVADDVGLLEADQVEWVALHEIGHALGMRGHSPIPADLMYERERDRIAIEPAGLSTEDVNSFVSLYRLPNGTVFKRLAPGGEPPAPPPRRVPGPPRLALAPHVDTRLDFEIRLPEGWTRVETPYGVVAIDGVTWELPDASFQVVVMRYPTIEAYLQRYRDHYLTGRRLVQRAELVVRGRRALQFTLQNVDRDYVEEFTFIETGDGRVIVVIADCGAESLDAYRPWFRATLASLDFRSQAERRKAAERPRSESARPKAAQRGAAERRQAPARRANEGGPPQGKAAERPRSEPKANEGRPLQDEDAGVGEGAP